MYGLYHPISKLTFLFKKKKTSVLKLLCGAHQMTKIFHKIIDIKYDPWLE